MIPLYFETKPNGVPLLSNRDIELDAVAILKDFCLISLRFPALSISFVSWNLISEFIHQSRKYSFWFSCSRSLIRFS